MTLKPPYYRPVEHSMHRRAAFHDYCAPGIYHLTFTALKGRPVLCAISASGEGFTKDGGIIISYTALGQCIDREIQLIAHYHPKLIVYKSVIMPDHIHLVLQVKSRLTRPLGCELTGFIAACNDAYRCVHGGAAGRYFDNFNDRIIMTREQLEKARQYVADNPYRYLVRRCHSDLFRRYLHIRVAGHEYAAYGNVFLLRHFDLMQVKISRHWNETQLIEYQKYCRARIANGAVCVSPFIHPVERAIRKHAVDSGGGIVHLRLEGFEDRFKPYGSDFELCAAGRLLLLAPWPDGVCAKQLDRSRAQVMNRLSADIASLSCTDDMSLCGEDNGLPPVAR